MGILDWFRHRAGHFDTDRVSEEMVRWAVDKAVTLTNPRLKLLPNYQKRLAPSVETTIRFLQGLVKLLPAVRRMSTETWSADAALRAIFVSPSDMKGVLARADGLRTLFEKYPELDEAYLVLGMAFTEQRVFGLGLQGDMLQRDVAQMTANFSDHKTRLCGADEQVLRRVIGVEIFEYLISCALSEIGAERSERQELQANRSLIRARLRLLQQHGPGLGSMLGEAPADASQQARLEAELLDNERQLETMGGGEAVLDSELETLKSVLDNQQDYLSIEPRRIRLSSMNVVLDETNTESGAEVDFAVIELKGTLPQRRAFVIGRLVRSELPPPQSMNYHDAMRYL
ncbi:MAG: hypothetical protein WBJ68_14520 [Candidatus Dechloromonas phosphoritropha]|jgi:hypothetical protein